MPVDAASYTMYRELAVDYYLMARQSIRWSMMPLSGNLCHHAIEMLLKSALLGTHTPEELRTKFGHNLVKLWREILPTFPNLSSFERVITSLHKWEDIRYLGFPKRISITMEVQLQKSEIVNVSHSQNRDQIDEYVLNLEEIDELFEALVKGPVRLNPEMVRMWTRKPGALEVYKWENRHPIF